MKMNLFGSEKINWVIVIVLAILIIGVTVTSIINDNRKPDVRLIGVEAFIYDDGEIELGYIIKNYGKMATGPIEILYSLRIDGEYLPVNSRDFTWFLHGDEERYMRVAQYTDLYVEKSVEFELYESIKWRSISLSDRKFLR